MMMMIERGCEKEECAPKANSPDLLAASTLERAISQSLAGKPGVFCPGRTRHEAVSAKSKRYRSGRIRLRVIAIDSRKHPEFLADREHPFVAMTAEARIKEIDSFCARLWACTKMGGTNGVGQVNLAAA